jgi:hypothetical protein
LAFGVSGLMHMGLFVVYPLPVFGLPLLPSTLDDWAVPSCCFSYLMVRLAGWQRMVTALVFCCFSDVHAVYVLFLL